MRERFAPYWITLLAQFRVPQLSLLTSPPHHLWLHSQIQVVLKVYDLQKLEALQKHQVGGEGGQGGGGGEGGQGGGGGGGGQGGGGGGGGTGQLRGNGREEGMDSNLCTSLCVLQMYRNAHLYCTLSPHFRCIARPATMPASTTTISLSSSLHSRSVVPPALQMPHSSSSSSAALHPLSRPLAWDSPSSAPYGLPSQSVEMYHPLTPFPYVHTQEGSSLVMVQEFCEGGDVFELQKACGGRLAERQAVEKVGAGEGRGGDCVVLPPAPHAEGSAPPSVQLLPTFCPPSVL